MSSGINTQDCETKGKQRATEVLEVEDEEQRHERMHDLLSRMNASASPVSSEPPPRSFDFGDRNTFPVAPPLELLSRVQVFLPELAASNADLLRRAKDDPNSVDIENVDDNQAQYIEMNLGLGVFETRGQAPSNIPVADVDLDLDPDRGDDVDMDSASDADSSSDSSDSTSDSESSNGTSDSDSDAAPIPSSTEAHGPGQTLPPRRIKPLPARNRQNQQDITSPNTRPEIVVLSESKSNDVDRSTRP